jgi:hypothetical protein
VPTLHKVKSEVDRVKERFEAAGASLTVINDTSAHPTVPGVLASLQGSDVNILHLSCHGVQKRDPLASAFLLRDGDLTIQHLMKLDLKHALLTFLSACQTAKGSQYQPDQAMHLAASMLFCGFKSVVATMWSVRFQLFGIQRADYLSIGLCLMQMGRLWRSPYMRHSSKRKGLTSRMYHTHSMTPFDYYERRK